MTGPSARFRLCRTTSTSPASVPVCVRRSGHALGARVHAVRAVPSRNVRAVKTAFKMFDEDGNGVLEEHEFLGRSFRPRAVQSRKATPHAEPS